MFLWSLCQDAIPTKENLFRRRILPKLCPLCWKHPNTVEHLLFFCKWTQNIWSNSCLNLSNSTRTATRKDKWLAEFFETKPNSLEEGFIAGVL